MTEAKSEYQRPEGRLIENALKGPPKISGRKLAEMAQLSEGRVRQIINGYRSEGGMAIPIVAPADTVARLGAALNLTAAAFHEAERPDVAEILREAAVAADRRAAEMDRQAMENPEPSDFWTSPEGDEVDEPVTWGHMEARLAEIEKRIVRLERQALRTAGRLAVSTEEEGGEGDVSRPSSTSRKLALTPDEETATGLSVVDDEVPAAAKPGRIEESGEFD